MASRAKTGEQRRPRLTRDRVLETAVRLADEGGIESLTMRKLGQSLGVEAMSLYNHVANKDDLLNGMVDGVWSGIELPATGGDWKASVRAAAVSAHVQLVRHPWACGLAMARVVPARLRYMEWLLGAFRRAGFPAELTFHAYHAVDSHVLGFTLWEAGHAVDEGADLAVVATAFLRDIADDHPHLTEHVEQHLAGLGRDGEGEFAFVLDLLLEGLERALGES